MGGGDAWMEVVTPTESRFGAKYLRGMGQRLSKRGGGVREAGKALGPTKWAAAGDMLGSLIGCERSGKFSYAVSRPMTGRDGAGNVPRTPQQRRKMREEEEKKGATEFHFNRYKD